MALPLGVFADAALYAIGAVAGTYLSSFTVDHTEVTLTVGDANDPQRAAVSFPLLAPPDTLTLTDAQGRPAGLLVSSAAALGVFQSFGVGTQTFKPAQTPFAATVCFPTPEEGVRGFLLPDGSLLTGDVWLVGDDGVVVREVDLDLSPLEQARPYRVVRIDVVGDPLFQRRLAGDSFLSPRPLRRLRVQGSGGVGAFTLVPDETGNIRIAANNAAAVDTVLRVRTLANGLQISTVGASAK